MPAEQYLESMTGPGAGIPVVAGNGAAGAPVDLSAHLTKKVAFRFPGKTHLRFGASGVAAATSDIYLLTDELQSFTIIPGGEFVSAWGVGGAHAGVAAVVSR